MFRKICYRVKFCALFLSVLGIIFCTPTVSALTDADLDQLYSYGVYYYDPYGGNDDCIPRTEGENVTVIGGTIATASAEEIKQSLPDVSIFAQTSKQFGTPEDAEVNPEGAKDNPSGISILKYLAANDKIKEHLVFSLGVSDKSLTAASVDEVLKIAGQSRNVYFVTNYDPDENSKRSQYFAANNQLFSEAAKNSNVQLIDWAAEVSKDPKKYLEADSIKPTAEGKTLFAQLIDVAVGGSASTTGGANNDKYVNYAGDPVLSDAQKKQLEKNIPIYEKAIAETGADKKGITWQILAAIHYKETGLSRYNPGNGQGVWQLYDLYQRGISFPPAGSISENEFLRQTKLFLEEELFGKAKGLNLANEDDVKRLFFGYNGMSGFYKAKAAAIGFTSEAEKNRGEGSPYVMNRYDAQRDPSKKETMNSAWKGLFVADGKYNPEATNLTFGAFTVFKALGGGGTNFCEGGGGYGSLGENGLTKEQAEDFMRNFVYNVNCDTMKGACGDDCRNGYKENCVAFSKYFAYVFEGLTKKISGNGGAIASAAAETKYFKAGLGSTPKPFAIFSISSGRTLCDGRPCGHTGVILGVNKEKDEIYIGETGCSMDIEASLTVVKSYSQFTKDYRYAYPVNVDTKKILEAVTAGSKVDMKKQTVIRGSMK